MPLLFSYGSLQRTEVQQSTFGRPLAGTTDVLPGFGLVPPAAGQEKRDDETAADIRAQPDPGPP